MSPVVRRRRIRRAPRAHAGRNFAAERAVPHTIEQVNVSRLPETIFPTLLFQGGPADAFDD